MHRTTKVTNTDGGWVGGGAGSGGSGAFDDDDDDDDYDYDDGDDDDDDDSTCMDGGHCDNNTTVIFHPQIFPENIK